MVYHSSHRVTWLPAIPLVVITGNVISVEGIDGVLHSPVNVLYGTVSCVLYNIVLYRVQCESLMLTYLHDRYTLGDD